MTTEATWLHLQQAHGFYDWHSEQVAERYAGLATPDGRVDMAGLHKRDHELYAGDLDHAHQEA